jgi:hypothetical protein
MVLVKEDGAWWIAAYHNVWRGALANRAAMDFHLLGAE